MTTRGKTAHAILRRSIVALCACLVFPSAPSVAFSNVGGLCDHAARAAAQKTGVPLSVLRAITRTETGRSSHGKLMPWPWTVNMEGKGMWFDTEDEARAYVARHFRRGARSFDVGCFQINYKWHGKAFRSIDEMFDPLRNALYAARFLKRLQSDAGDWSRAAGAYHSRTPEYAARYVARFEKLRAGLSEAPALLADRHDTLREPPRANGFPLLKRTTATPQLGSLVALAGSARGGLFEPARN